MPPLCFGQEIRRARLELASRDTAKAGKESGDMDPRYPRRPATIGVFFAKPWKTGGF